MILPENHELLPYVTVKNLADGREYKDIVKVNDPPGTYVAKVQFDVTTSSSMGKHATSERTVGFRDPFELRLLIPDDIKAIYNNLQCLARMAEASQQDA